MASSFHESKIRHRIYQFGADAGNHHVSYESTGREMERPKWAAGGIVSDVVNLLINSPIYQLMKPVARQVLINTAETNGIAWSKIREEFEEDQSEIDAIYDEVENKELTYPPYYTQPFHAYDEGNLNFKAAYECESATMSMALRVWPNEGDLTAKAAQDRLRASYIDCVKEYATSRNIDLASAGTNIVDVGCSVGVSTFYLADSFPESKISALDLSPHFLSVAKKRVKTANEDDRGKYEKIDWIHGNIEHPPAYWKEKFDWVSCSFIFHELPKDATERILKQLAFIVKKGGVIALSDNNPRSPVIQNLPAPIFTLMKATEPWTDEYYVFNFEDYMEGVLGLEDVQCVETDPRHRTIMGWRK